MIKHSNSVYRGWGLEEANVNSPEYPVDDSHLIVSVNDFSFEVVNGELIRESGDRPPDFARLLSLARRYSLNVNN